MKKKCEICHEREATVPDREKGGRQKRICAQCHAERLKADLAFILKHRHREDSVAERTEGNDEPEGDRE